MPKPLPYLLAVAALASLSSCFTEEPPPPNFRPYPAPYAPETTSGEPRQDDYATETPPPEPTRPAPPPPTANGGYPMATRTANPNEVLSPYEPYNVINIEGFKSGALARDPSNKKIFQVP